MQVKDELLSLIEQLPEELQEKVADFARFLLAKRRSDEQAWQHFSIQQALRDLPEEDYSESDLKERW